ncbi:MAG: cytoskeleton protein RodZ [Candidatus Azotimanducaceae bacterium]|jgi:cytoskeleton protein RodZ
MQSIGERMEEARKRKGISLREAAEATKIRGDFLGYIEQNKMDFDLPEIYKRGFLKNYARFLKLDVDKVMTDYNAQQLSSSRLDKKNGAEWFGQMEITKGEGEESTEGNDRVESEEPAPYGRIAAKPARTEKTGAGYEEADKTFYMKIGLIFVGTLALVFVVFGLIWAILDSGGSEESSDSPELRDPTQIAQPANVTPPAAVDNNSITLIASGNVYVLVKQRAGNIELYRKTMSAGETVTLEKEGEVDILFTAGENIVIEQGSERFRPNTTGTAKITLQ